MNEQNETPVVSRNCYTHRKKISVIIPVYNTERYVADCLESLLRQTLEGIEIICVNDASPDGSLAILREYERGYPDRIIVIDSPVNLNQGGARNLGIKSATGEYMAFVDSDDWVADDFYELLYNSAIKKNAEFVCGSYCVIKNNEIQFCSSEITTHINSNDTKKEMMLKGVSVCTYIVKNTIFKQYSLRFPENTYYEDNEIAMLPFILSNQIAIEHNAKYYYRIREGSTTQTMSLKHVTDRIKTSKMMVEHIKKHGRYIEFADEVDFIFYRIYCEISIITIFRMKKNRRDALKIFRKDLCETFSKDDIHRLYNNKYVSGNCKYLDKFTLKVIYSFPQLCYPLILVYTIRECFWNFISKQIKSGALGQVNLLRKRLMLRYINKRKK